MVGKNDVVVNVVFLIEGTAINGAYLSDMKNNYIIPTLEYFSHQGSMDERDGFFSEPNSFMYGAIMYKTAQCLPGVSCTTYGPFTNPQKVLNVLDKLDLSSGKSESNANLAEGLATALVCFDDMNDLREDKRYHCILICNSAPYLMPVTENAQYEHKTVKQMASLFQEKNVNPSILSPRKIPILIKIFEKADGDMSSLINKNYAKDPRHLVLLKGYSLKERPVSPSAANSQSGSAVGTALSAPSPLSNINQNMPNMEAHVMGQNQNPLMRNSSGGLPNQIQQQAQQAQAAAQQAQAAQQQAQQAQAAQQQAQQVQQQAQSQAQQVQLQVQQAQQQAQQAQQQQQQQMNFNNPMTQQQQQQMRWAAQQQQRQFPNQNANPQQQNTNSALISQLSTPPNNQPSMLNNITPQIRLQMQQQAAQQAQQQQVQQQQQQQQQQQGMQSGMQPGMPRMQQGMPGMQPGMQTGMQPGMQQLPNKPPQGAQVVSPRERIWTGVIEWIEKSKSDQQKNTHRVPCHVTANIKDGEPEIKAENWPTTLLMQLMPKQLVGNIGGQFLKESKTVVFHPSQCEALDTLTNMMSTGFAGCVHFNQSQQCDIKVMILLYAQDKKVYLGFVPENQLAFVARLRKVIQQKQGLSKGVAGNPTIQWHMRQLAHQDDVPQEAVIIPKIEKNVIDDEPIQQIGDFAKLEQIPIQGEMNQDITMMRQEMMIMRQEMATMRLEQLQLRIAIMNQGMNPQSASQMMNVQGTMQQQQPVPPNAFQAMGMPNAEMLNFGMQNPNMNLGDGHIGMGPRNPNALQAQQSDDEGMN